ncbi:glycosyltransferase [Candidatus Bathyarchaeota archaeon]|nr:glycosyltransferase [Candidatus Bathyarchaeota archaeon]
MIKLSIIFTIYNSHEVVKRQIKHFKRLDLPDDIEIIIMDDESNPPLETLNPHCYGVKNFCMYRTGNKAPWTQALARNQSVEKARGDLLLFTDIDHFFPRETIMACRDFDGDKMMFNRSFGVLDHNGDICTDRKTLIEYGMKKTRRLRRNRHNNSFVIKKSVYQRLGGYSKKYWENRFHRSGDSSFYTRYENGARRGKFKPSVTDHKIYVFPEANPDPLGLFHDLSRQDGPIPEDKP